MPDESELRALRAASTAGFHVCVCGRMATVATVVHWKNGDRTYWYCPSCALDVCALDGVEPQ